MNSPGSRTIGRHNRPGTAYDRPECHPSKKDLHMPNIGTPELLIILLVVVLIFGSAKLPQLARSLGKSARILKAETKGLREDDDDAPADRPAKTMPSSQGEDARDRAARLREEAARLEREAA